MKRLIYIGIFFLFLITNNTYAAVTNVALIESDYENTLVITADAVDAGKNAYISWEEGVYLVTLALNEDGSYSQASILCGFDGDSSYLNSSEPIPSDYFVWFSRGNHVFEFGISGEDSENFIFECCIPGIVLNYAWSDDASSYMGYPCITFYVDTLVYGRNYEDYVVDINYVSPSGKYYWLGDFEVSSNIYNEDEDGAYAEFYIEVDKWDFMNGIEYDVYDGYGYIEINLYDNSSYNIDYASTSVDIVISPEISCMATPNVDNVNHIDIEAYVDWFGLDGTLEYCITTESYIMGDETWTLSENLYQIITEVLVYPSDGKKFLHIRADNSMMTAYETVDITNYKVWTGADNSYSSDNTSVSYSGGIITISGTIYSNVPGKYRIEALNNKHEFELSGETVSISGSYDSDSYCYCHEYYGSSYCYECGESLDKYFEGELHDYSEPCKHVSKGYIYKYSMQIDAKKSGIAEGDLTSITYSIKRRDDLTYSWDTKKEGTLSTSFYIDLTPPKISMYKDDGGSGSSRSYVLKVSDDKGLQSYVYYDFVEADSEDEFDYKRIDLFKTYTTSSSTGNYSGSNYGSTGDTTGYGIVSVTIPENEIMRYKVIGKITDIYGNTTEFISNPLDCGDYTVNITYKLKSSEEIVYKKVVETNVSEYVLDTPEVIKVDDVNYNKIQSNWAEATYKTSKASALDEISGNTVTCSAFSETDSIIDLTIYLEDIKYKLYEYEEGDDLTAKIAEKLGLSLAGCTDGETAYTFYAGFKGLDGNKIWPAGVYDNKLYFGYEQEKVVLNNSREGHYRNTYFIRYDLETEEIEYVKVGGESSSSSWTKSYDWMDIKILKKPYEYTKAVDLEGSTILMEDGSIYEMVYWMDDDRDVYNQYTYRINDVVELLPGTITYMSGSDYWDAGLVRTKNGSIYAVHRNSYSQKSTASLVASNGKIVAALDHESVDSIKKKLRGAFVKVYNTGALTVTAQWYRNSIGSGKTNINLESEGVKAFYSKYYLKESNGVYEIYRIDTTDVDAVEKSLIYSSTSPISEENFYGTMIMQEGNFYSISSGSLKLICSDVKEIDGSYVLSNSGYVYNTSGSYVSGLSNIVDICDGYARSSSGVVYSISSKSSIGITVNANIKSAASCSGASFILFENGDLYAKGSISDGPVLGGETSFEKFKTGIKDMSIGDMYGYDSIKIITSEGEVLGVGNRFYGGFTTTYKDLIDSDETYVTEFSRVANLPYEDENQYDDPIWMTYYVETISGNSFEAGFKVYDFDLVENESATITTIWNEHIQLDYVYTRIQNNIPDEYLIDISNIGGATITPAMLRRADVENRLYNIDKNLDIAADVILEKGEGQDKKYGVICKKLNTWYMDDSDYSWYTYKIMWFKIEEYGGIDISFELPEDAKTFEQGAVYLNYKITVDEEVDIYFNDIINNLVVTKGGEVTSGAEKVLFRLQKSTGEIIPFNLDSSGKMKIGAGMYKLTVLIGGVNCFTTITSGGEGYLLTLEQLRFDVLREGEWIHKLANLGLIKPVEVIQLVDLT